MEVRLAIYARVLPLGGLGEVPCAQGGLIQHQTRAVLRGLISELPTGPVRLVEDIGAMQESRVNSVRAGRRMRVWHGYRPGPPCVAGHRQDVGRGVLGNARTIAKASGVPPSLKPDGSATTSAISSVT